MYNAAIKLINNNIFRGMLLGLPLLITACGGGSEKEKAKALLTEAQTAYEHKDYTVALGLIDSLKSRFPREIDVRREALHLSALATEGKTLRELELADSLVAQLNIQADSLQQKMKFVSNPIEGYYVAKTANPATFIGSTGLQARMSPDGDFYLMSSLKAKAIKSTSVTVSTATASATTANVAHDGERNDRSMGAEVITFMGAECDSVGHFVSENYASPMTVTFNGTSTYSQPLSQSQAHEIALVYDYSTLIRRFKIATLEKERLSKALELARSQAARTYVETPTEE